MTPTWQSPQTQWVAPGEALNIYATFDEAVSGQAVLQVAGDFVQVKHQTLHLREVAPDTPLAAMAGAARLSATHDADAREAVAMQYGLVSEHTNLLLVYERAEDAKADGLPALAATPQMVAAGWGGTSTVHEPVVSLQCSVSIEPSPRIRFSKRSDSVTHVNSLSTGGMEDFEIPAFLRKQEDDAPSTASKMRFGIDKLMRKVSFSGGGNDIDPSLGDGQLVTPLSLPELAELMARAALREIDEDEAQQALTPWPEFEALMCEHIADGGILEFWFAALAWLLKRSLNQQDSAMAWPAQKTKRLRLMAQQLEASQLRALEQAVNAAE